MPQKFFFDFGSQNGDFRCILGTISILGYTQKRHLAEKKYCKASLLGFLTYSYKIN